MPHHYLAIVVAVGFFLASLSTAQAAGSEDAKKPSPPAVGDQAPDFTLQTLDRQPVQLSKLTQQGPVVLLVLRGYPGYQCPICTRQVGEFVSRAKDFAAAKANVVLVYPGPAKNLAQFAAEFKGGQTIPAHFHFVIDPDYTFTNAWHLRWDAPRETAYPSTFLIGPQGKVLFAKVSMTHGGRAKASEVLEAIK